MTAGLSVQSHTVFIKLLLPVSTVVANNEMCGTGAMTSLCNRIMYWAVPIHMEQVEGLMQIVQFSKNKKYLNSVEKFYNKRTVGSKKILGTILQNMNSTAHARMYEPHNKQQHDHSWQ